MFHGMTQPRLDALLLQEVRFLEMRGFTINQVANGSPSRFSKHSGWRHRRLRYENTEHLTRRLNRLPIKVCCSRLLALRCDNCGARLALSISCLWQG